MLTVPVFRPWRPVWDAAIGSATRRLDELATERQKGRRSPPAVTPELLGLIRGDRVQAALNGSTVPPVPDFLQAMREIEPLLRACVWPRWLLLEAALEQASSSGALHLSALVLRTQIEELDALRAAAAVLATPEDGSWEEAAVAGAITTLKERVLPRVQPRTAEQLVEQAPAAIFGSRAPALQQAFDRLGEYVHPNYGSHILCVRPHTPEVARVFIEAFVAVYEAFLSLPWAQEADDVTSDAEPHRGSGWEREATLRKVKPPFLVLAEETTRALAPYHPAAGELGAVPWIDAINCFHRKLERDSHREAEAHSLSDAAMREALAAAGVPELNVDVEAIPVLREHLGDAAGWPEPLNRAAGRDEYAHLVKAEQQLVEDAERVGTDSSRRDDRAWLSLLLSGLTFSINITEFKLDVLARHAALLINDDNVLGATLVVRSMLEHHAVAIELGTKLRTLWERAERGAPSEKHVAPAFAEAEKQIARVLASSSGTRETSAAWRTTWEQTVRKHYNVMEPVRALDAKAPGFLKTYGLLSHVVHGTVCTGGDLLRTHESKNRAGQRTLSQLVLNLASLIDVTAMMYRQAGAIGVALRLDTARRGPEGIGTALKSMRILEGQKLKHGRDVFGSGTKADPFRFRRGLIYHDAYDHWPQQEGVQVRARWGDLFAGGVGDRVETEDGRTLYFLNESIGPREQ